MATTDSNTFSITLQNSTALNAAIAGMSVNSWVAYKTSGWPAGYWAGEGSNSDRILAYVHSGVRDSSRMKVFFCGAGYGPNWFCTYNEVTDTWSRASYGTSIHAWDHTGYNQITGEFFWGSQGGSNQYKINVDAGTNTSQTSPWGSDFIDTYGMEYWPSLDSVMFTSRNGPIIRRTAAGSVSTFGAIGSSLGLHPALIHNPVRNVMYITGGQSSTLWREVSTAGSVTTLSNAPVSLDGTRQKVLCGDVTGDAILFNFASGTVYKYVHGSGWSQITTSWPSAITDTTPGTIAIPLRGVAGREVFMLIRATGDSSASCYLYRYS